MAEKQYQDIEERTFLFAVRIVKMVNQLPRTSAGWELGKQTVRAGTSINSNIIQARAGLSRADFINHMRIARKEAKETKRWIQMMVAADLINSQRVALILKENEEIIKILVTIVKNAGKSKI